MVKVEAGSRPCKLMFCRQISWLRRVLFLLQTHKQNKGSFFFKLQHFRMVHYAVAVTETLISLICFPNLFPFCPYCLLIFIINIMKENHMWQDLLPLLTASSGIFVAVMGEGGQMPHIGACLETPFSQPSLEFQQIHSGLPTTMSKVP